MRTTSLRTRLLFSFMLASVTPILVAILIAVPWYARSVNQQAERALEANSTVAAALLSENATAMRAYSEIAARAVTIKPMSEAELRSELARQAVGMNGDLVMWVDRKGDVITSRGDDHTLAWPEVAAAVKSRDQGSFFSIAPGEEFAAMGLSDRYKVAVKKTEGGSAPQSEADGVLTEVVVRPVQDSVSGLDGSIVIVSPLKGNNEFVDSLASKLGGAATIFQNGVRVATTVKDASGSRAIGTAVSDKVRAATLAKGVAYRGEAPVLGKPYLTAYNPIKNSDNETIGMLFVGLDKAPYDSTVRGFAIAMALVAVVAILVGIIPGGLASRALAAPIIAVSDAAEHVATGDLTVKVPEVGFTEARRMGAAFNTMTAGLREILGVVGSSSDRLDNVSAEIAKAASYEADSATSQASAVAEASATVQEIDRSFAAVADGARRVLEIAEDSLAVAENGREAVTDGAGQVERLASGAVSVRESANQLAEVANDIDQVTFVIGSIAEQTKILALNAAIEAARAGAAGKGFGVVATEIRNLADSVSTSIGRIDELVRAIQASSKALTLTAEQQASDGQHAVVETMRTRDSFDAIFDRMERTASAAREIASAASQQQSAARSIVEVMQQVSQGVSGTAASARQLAEAAGDVEREANGLAGNLRRFRH